MTPLAALGLPLILKTASSGYDGKGQILVETAAEAPDAWASLGRKACGGGGAWSILPPSSPSWWLAALTARPSAIRSP